jgi:hypothetical protein
LGTPFTLQVGDALYIFTFENTGGDQENSF